MKFGKRLAGAVLTAAASVIVLPSPEGMAAVDVIELTAQEIQAGLASDAFTITEIVDGYLDRIDEFELYYNAFTWINPNAKADAAALQAEYDLSGPRSPLHGTAIVIKDSMDVAGVRTTGGYTGFTLENGGVDLIPENDSPIVARLRAAGVVILGKTNLPRFARSGSNADSSFDGRTYNAYGFDFIPGGSSSGSATATSASFATMGTAEETGGSIQNPAGAQALVGVKTTFGLVPTSGGIPLAGSTRDVFGPVAKSVWDAAAMLDVIGGSHPSDPKTSGAIIPAGGYVSGLSDTALQGKKIGLWGPGFKNVTLTAETQALYSASVEALKAQGAIVVENPFQGSTFMSLVSSFQGQGSVSLPYDIQQWLANLGPSAAANSIAEFKDVTGLDLFAANGPLVGNINAAVAAAIANPDVLPDLTPFFDSRAALLAEFRKVMDEKDIDAFFFPQMWDKLGQYTLFSGFRNTSVSEINLLGTPGVNLSGGYFENGSPFSVQFLGDVFSEGTLLSMAYDFEQATNFRVAPILAPEPGTALTLLTVGMIAFCRKRRAA